MSYQLGSRSKERLRGVDKRLVNVVELAITLTEQDFTVLEGLRSLDRQRELVKKGASRTMSSKHITGHAVDLGAWDQETRSIRWEEAMYYPIAEAMMLAASRLETPICWGGAWASFGNEYPFDITQWQGTAQEAVENYVELRYSQGRKPFFDGPHVELIL